MINRPAPLGPSTSLAQKAASEFEHDVVSGLARFQRSIPPKYFYDAAGSKLFDRICELPEYYVTRTELHILTERAREIATQIGPRAELIEFGAGSLTKVRLIIDAFTADDAPRRYLPIDISGEHLQHAAQRLRADYPQLAVQPIAADYTMPLILPASGGDVGHRVGFFPGSTIGNFQEDEALAFLQQAARLLQGGGLLIGVDLVKDPARLHAAYNDELGVTAQFNLNLLRRINNELGANFDLNGFVHHATYNPLERRIEMYLVSRRAQTVQLGDEELQFDEGDTIHTENSHKFTIKGFRDLAVKAGFRPGTFWTDPERLFSVHWLNSPARGCDQSN